MNKARPRVRNAFEGSLWRETECPRCGHSMLDHGAPNKLTLLSRLLDGEKLDVAKMPFKWMNCTAKGTDRDHCRLPSEEGMRLLLEEAYRRRGN